MIYSHTPPDGEEPFTCGVIDKSPNWRNNGRKWLCFDNFRILYLLEGRGRVTGRDGREMALAPGSLLLRPAGWEHSIRRSSLWKEFFFTAPSSAGQLLLSSGLLGRESIMHPGLHPALDRFCRDLEGTVRNREQAHRIVSAMFRLMEEIKICSAESSREGEKGLSLDQALSFLEDQRYFYYSLPEIAEKCGFSYENFRKLFRRRYGRSPGDYRIKIRMDLARDLLNRRDLSIGEISEILHYPDPYSFSRQFSRWMGCSPRDYRRSLWV